MNIAMQWGRSPLPWRSRGGADRSFAVFLSLVFMLTLFGGAQPAQASPERIRNIRFFTAPEHTRIVLDMSKSSAFEVRRVHNPERLAINVGGAVFDQLGVLKVGDGLVRTIRTNQGSQRAQVVIDLESGAQFRSFSLPATGSVSDRIVIDVIRPLGKDDSPAKDIVATVAPLVKPTVVIIDPGHGGYDPGAIRHGVSEKDVALDISREMARLINAMPGYRAHLTRNGDYFRELWQRVEFARKMDGDLFLSIHCNTAKNSRVKGMEVYFLSLEGATDRQAQELADKENAAELVGLDPADLNSELVMEILMDLRMTRVLQESARLSHHIIDAGKASGVVSGRKVKQARFQVLKSLAMPSALIEVAYMSNSDDLAVLREKRGRLDLAAVLVGGVESWRHNEPAILQIATNEKGSWNDHYRVRRGDSLWGLARRHGTTVTEITRHNNLRSGAINVGQVLNLPRTVNTP
ncbi:MAG: N-acetylmuramoyl-L-alanine amidase [Candidatus Krumholzibacteriia bacterium]|jgi:N-acetylmuramoyl-L-alanine amidase